MTPMETALMASIVGQVVDVMQDYRVRRLRWMKEHPEHLGDDDAVPEELTREAEAAKIISLLIG